MEATVWYFTDFMEIFARTSKRYQRLYKEAQVEENQSVGTSSRLLFMKSRFLTISLVTNFRVVMINPLIMVPRNANSTEVCINDLGKITLTNSYTVKEGLKKLIQHVNVSVRSLNSR